MPIKKKVLEFYQDKQLPVAQLVAKRPVNITKSQVELAAMQLYEKIQSGLFIKDLILARKVWDIAREINTTEYDAEQIVLDNYKQNLAMQTTLKKRYAFLLIVVGVAFSLLAGWNLYNLYWDKICQMF